jgi:hypothetical protein
MLILPSHSPQAPTPQLLKDKFWRLSNLYYITNKHGEKILFRPNRAQLHFLKNRIQRSILLKSRQLGFTTLASIDMLDDILFNPNFHSLLISYDEDSAKRIFQNKVLFAFEHFNPDLKNLYQVDSSRSNQLRVDLGEGNYSDFQVDNTGRSGTFNHVHISELGAICAQFPEKIDKIIRGTFPSVHPPHGRITIESTSEGPTGDYYEMFIEAFSLPISHQYRPTEFKAFFYNWQWDDESLKFYKEPNIDLINDHPEFKEIQKKHNELARFHPDLYQPLTDIHLTFYIDKFLELKKSWRKLFLEYPLTVEDAFKSSSRNIFNLDVLNKLLLQAKLQTPLEQNGWLVYGDINPTGKYIVSADPSEGIGQDHSAATLWRFDLSKPKVVATFTDNRIPPDIFAHTLAQMGNIANSALIMVERNNHGHAVLQKLKAIYPADLIYKEQKTEYEDNRETEKLGWLTTLGNKPDLLYDFATAVNSLSVDIPSPMLINEMLKYDRNDLLKIKSKDDESTHHFDLLMAAAIGFRGRSEIENISREVSVKINSTNSDPYALI